MGVSAASADFLASFNQSSAESTCILNYFTRVVFEFGGANLLQLHCKGSDLVVVRSTLETWEHGVVDSLLEFFPHKNDT